MNCVSLVMLLFVIQIKTIYLLKLDNQAVDKKNTEDHSPSANVNYINLCTLCYDCLDPGRSKTSKAKVSQGRKRTENSVTAATVYRSLL